MGALSCIRGIIAPAYSSSKPGICSQPPENYFSRGKNFGGYFFFFLPAFFFIALFSFGLDLRTVRFTFLLTGIDTSSAAPLLDKLQN